MADYTFYQKSYGGSCGEKEFAACVARAQAQLERYERQFTVSYPRPDSRDMAICAILEEMLSTGDAAGNIGRVQEVRTGSVSTRYALRSPDRLAANAARRYYDAARMHADIYRGVLTGGDEP